MSGNYGVQIEMLSAELAAVTKERDELIQEQSDHAEEISALTEREERAKSILLEMDCDCAGEGVTELGGCFRCLALMALT